MSNFSFATLRLGKTSVDDIKTLNGKPGGVLTASFPISVVCTQIPADLVVGTYAFIWLGSDNSKGMPTEWKQGFKAIGRITAIDRGEKYNDESTISVDVLYIFPDAVNRLDILRDAAAAYYWCSSMPIIGLDDHSNQTIRMLTTGERSDIGAFFTALNAVHKRFHDEIVEIDPDFDQFFRGDFCAPMLNGGDLVFLSHEWFRAKTHEYPNVDEEANALYQQFQTDFSIEKLKALSGEELPSRIFLGKTDDNLCNAIEFDARYSQFGSIAGGTAYKYSLYYSKSNQSWQTSFGEGGQRSITEEEAIVIGKQIRDALVAGAEIISGYEEITTANDYNGLLATLTETIPQYITKMWFLKYYHMMFPNIIPNFYNENWHKYILCNLGIIPSDAQFIRMGQINCFVKECGISNIVFNRIIHDTLGAPKVLYRIGTGDNGELMPEWRRDNYVAIGWNELGDLGDAYKDGVDSKAVITNGLKEGWNYDARLASRKYGEINNFYSAIADSTYIVAMKGQRILGIGMLSGNYYFAPEKDYAHCRAVNWIRLFDEEKILPQASEGTRTTFYPLTNSENLCYLYALIHKKDDVTTEESKTGDSIREIKFHTGYMSAFPRNRILFGAPGTGKSFTLNKERSELLGVGNETDYERVTFHPDYSYANFVGTYKPVPVGDVITYSYVPGPFMRVYVEALKNGRTDDVKPFLLIIEEINRANVAAVFGDVFQLLDRSSDEASEYPIQASEDIKKYLAKELGGMPENYTKIRIPDNMFIWATMNSADQGVFPMDTAFKRRWDFTYLGINTSEAGIRGKKVILGIGENARVVEWNELRHAINDRLSSFKINEDKLLGPYFLSKKIVSESGEIVAKRFIDTFKSKVLMYLFDDAAKQKRPSLFAEGIDVFKYSSICEVFDLKGVFVFCSEISNRFNDIPTQTETTTETDIDATEGEN